MATNLLKRPFQGWYWKGKRLRQWARSLVQSPQSITHRDGLQKLNLGAGARPLPGWINQDLKPLPGIDLVCDACDLADLPAAEYDVVRASHLLEHIYLKDVPGALRTWVRLLKPGGTLMICVPDFRSFVQSYLDDPAIIDCGHTPLPIDWEQPVTNAGYLVRLFGGWYDIPDHPHMKHRMVYDRASLSAMLRQHAGLESVQEFDYRHEQPFLLGVEDDSTNVQSLNIVGRKPMVEVSTAASVTH